MPSGLGWRASLQWQAGNVVAPGAKVFIEKAKVLMLNKIKSYN